MSEEDFTCCGEKDFDYPGIRQRVERVNGFDMLQQIDLIRCRKCGKLYGRGLQEYIDKR